MTLNIGEFQAEGREDEEEQHVDNLDNFIGLDMETFNDFEERSTEAPTILEGQGTEDPTVLEGQGTEAPTIVDERGTETPIELERQGDEFPKKLEEHGSKSLKELSAQGIETLGIKTVEGIKTLSDKKTQSVETLGDVIRQTFDNLDLDDDGTCLESVAEKTFTPKYLSTEPSTLHLNNRIVELEQQVHDLEALNQVMKEQSWQKQSEVELLVEVKRQKQ